MIFVDFVGEVFEPGYDVFGLKGTELDFPNVITGPGVYLIDESLLGIIDLGSDFFVVLGEFENLGLMCIDGES